MAGLRIECLPAEIEEIYSRLQHVFHTNDLSKSYPNRDSNQQRYYLRIYTYEKDTLLDQLLAAQKDLQELTTEREQLLATIKELQQQLGTLPQPRPWDAVLGDKHRKP